MTKKLDLAANLAILVVAAIATFVLVKNYQSRRTAAATPVRVSVGSELSMPGVDWKANAATVVLALSTTCQYCTDSAPFYTRLADELSRRGVHFMVVLPQSVEEGSRYLRALNVDCRDVRQVSMRDVRIRGTPTLLLVDERGVIRYMREGRLSPDEERSVLEAIQARG